MTFGTPSSPRRLLARTVSALTYPLSPTEYLRSLRPADAAGGRIESIGAASLDAVTVTIRPARGFPRHAAGQFVRLGVDVDGVRHWRCYSISSAPERADGCFTLTVKAIADGRVSNHIVDNLAAGDRVQLEPPAGEFVLPASIPERLLFVTAGSGITPVMSMLASLDARGAMPDVTVIHAAPTAADMIFRSELEALAVRHSQLRLHRIHTRESGRLTADRLEALCPDWRNRETWACGPDALLQALEVAWQQAGIGERLHVERFRPRQLQTDGATESGRVQFLRSQRETTGHGNQPLLELAEQNGLAPAHGCRMGICHGCTAALKSGCVRDLRSGQTFDEEGDLVQICVCAPVGDVEIDL